MSSCLVLQAKDKLYIGADTSSSVFINNKLYRLNNNTKKLFLLNANTVLYCAGNNSIAEKVVQHISSIYCRNDFHLMSLKNWLIEMYPYKNKDKTVYDVEILIATFKNNSTIVYQMSQYKNYDIVSFEVSDAGIQILSAGIKNTECMLFAENELLNKSGAKSIFRTTFNNLSCNYIGGCLDLYEITKNGAVKIFDSERINESGIQYANEICNSTSVSLNAEVLVSKLIMSENLWLENNSGNYKFDDNGFTATSGKNTIKIQPNNSGELFSIYKDSNKQFYINSDGDVEYAGTLRGATGIFSGLISGGEININNTFTVDSTGSMYASKGTIGGWSINKNYIYSDNGKTSDGRTLKSIIQPGQILFADINSQNDCMVINYDCIGWERYLTKITKNMIQTDLLSGNDLTLRSSTPKISSSGTITFNSNINFSSSYRVNFNCGDGNNVHFYNTPYIDKYSCYLARQDWCNSNFAKINHSHSEISNLSSKIANLSNQISSLTYTVNNHNHPKYTTESEVRSIVRSMMKD